MIGGSPAVSFVVIPARNTSNITPVATQSWTSPFYATPRDARSGKGSPAGVGHRAGRVRYDLTRCGRHGRSDDEPL